MPLEFTTTDADLSDHGVKMLIYGPAGVGKTALLATMPGETVILSAESGLLSLQPANQIRMFGVNKNINVITIRTAFDLMQAYDLVASPHGARFDSVGLDSLSEIAEVVLAAELSGAKDPRKAYGTLVEVMTKYIRLFRDLPGKHVYMTAKQDREKDSNGVMLYGPSMPGKQLTQGVAHFFDEVFALSIGNLPDGKGSYRYLRTRPDLQFHAKDRSGALAEIEEPNLAKVIAKIQNRNV